MTITDGTRVSLEYTLRHEGQTLESNVGGDPLIYTHGDNQIIPGLERQLEGMKQGDSKEVTVAPQDAYGAVDQEAYIEVKKDQVPEQGRVVGAQLMTKDPQGNVLRPTVREIKDSTVVLDFNHPLAGKTLVFDVRVVDVEQSASPASS
ncbi:MAG: peptidylprolyl isomerase [Bdellovibrionales bacterium]|nr:peptidylprolyl isomerase [Bdellovibrionales bacterium]